MYMGVVKGIDSTTKFGINLANNLVFLVSVSGATFHNGWAYLDSISGNEALAQPWVN